MDTTNKRGRGRPRLPEWEGRKRAVLVKLTETELTRYRRQAQSEGLTLSAWLRARAEQ